MTVEKTYTLVLTDSELDVVFEALDEFKNSIDDEQMIEQSLDVIYKIYEACKVTKV